MPEIITASAVRFNELSATHDGYTLLYEDNKVCRSDVKLSELVGDKSAYLTEEKANTLYQGKGDYLSASTSANFYPMIGNPSGFLTTEKDWTDTIKTASANAVNTTSAWVSANYYNIEEINDFLDEKYDKSETSSKNELNLAFDTKQDKGDYYSASNPSGFITGVDLSNYYTKNETSGAGQLSAEFEKYMEIPIGLSGDKQYGYTVSGWEEISAGSNLSAGTDLKIENDVVSVDTNGSAVGKHSFVEGGNTLASQSYSHAEGFQTSAVGQGSHSEGQGTIAVNYAHAEGQFTHAEGEDSHAEGQWTSALGPRSHTEGHTTIANGTEAHAEGFYTSAKGDYSHSEGSYTIAGDNNMHVGGKYNKTSANAAFVIGNGTADDARSDAFIVYPDGSVSAQGKISADGVELGAGGGGGATYNAGQGIKISNDNTISISSVGCSVTGTYAFAEGANNSAHGYYSHAEGYQTWATGGYSHSEGYGTRASHNYSHAEGYQTTADSYADHAEGVKTKTNFSASHAEGSATSAINVAAHAEGAYTQATHECTHAEGYYTTAAGYYSHAEGAYTKAAGYYSHAEGYHTSAEGQETHVEGSYTKATGGYSHAEGWFTSAIGLGSHAAGVGTQAENDYETVVGVCNLTGRIDNPLFVVGNGNWSEYQSSERTYSDAFVVNKAGIASASNDIKASGISLIDLYNAFTALSSEFAAYKASHP